MNVKHKGIGTVLIASAVVAGVIVPYSPASPVAFAASSVSDPVVTFRDKGLEKVVRDSLEKPSSALKSSDLAKVEWIEIKSSAPVLSLEELNKLPNVTSFWMEGHAELNLMPLTQVKKLDRLSLQQASESQVKSVVPRLTGLHSLFIIDSGLTDLSFVAPLKNLIQLNVDHNQIRDLSPLSGMSRLNQLSAARNEISDIRSLAGLPLREVELGSNLIEDASPLLRVADPQSLHHLDLASNKLTDLSFVLKFPNLNVLDPFGNDSASYAAIYPVLSKSRINLPIQEADWNYEIPFEDPALEQAVRTAASKPEGALTLADTADIFSLNVSSRGIRSLKGLEFLPQLVSLNASGNQISDLTPLRHMKKLTTLSLKGNPIKDYAPIRDVARRLVDKDFDPGLKVASTVKVSTFMQLVQAAETAQDKKGATVKLILDNPSLRNYETYSELVYYFYDKYPTQNQTYRYVNPNKAVRSMTEFTFNLGNASYASIQVSAEPEYEEFILDTSEYEHPVAADNLKAESDIQSDHAEIKNLAREITAGAKSDREKMFAIHQWVAGNIHYDHDTLSGKQNRRQDALSVLRAKTGVCAGYSRLTAALGRAVGIPVQYVAGYITNGDTWDIVAEKFEDHQYSHAWNQAYVDGKWIILDTTWDSSEYNSKGEKELWATQEYFDPDPVLFASSHTYYIPNPSPSGLSEFYFELKESDDSAAREAAWSDVWKKENMMGTTFFYSTFGHMRNGEVTAGVVYRVPDGNYVIYTLARDAEGVWQITDRKKVENYLPPKPAFRLAKY